MSFYEDISFYEFLIRYANPLMFDAKAMDEFCYGCKYPEFKRTVRISQNCIKLIAYIDNRVLDFPKRSKNKKEIEDTLINNSASCVFKELWEEYEQKYLAE